MFVLTMNLNLAEKLGNTKPMKFRSHPLLRPTLLVAALTLAAIPALSLIHI